MTMKDEHIEAMSEEVWRGVMDDNGEDIHVAIGLVDGALSPRFWCPSRLLPPGRWHVPAPSFGYRIMSAWALSERARAEKAEKIAAAERALRIAIVTEDIARTDIDDMNESAAMGRAVYLDNAESAAAEVETNRCREALQLLGVDP
jgi:hypothetical protein